MKDRAPLCQVLLCIVFAFWLIWLVAAEEVDHKVTLLVYCILARLVGSRTAVGVESVGWNDSETGEYGWMPLDDVFLTLLANSSADVKRRLTRA